MEIVYKIF